MRLGGPGCAVVMACAAIAACGGGSRGAGDAPAAAQPTDLLAAPWLKLGVQPAIAELAVGARLQLHALVDGEPAAGATWTVVDGARGGSVDSAGVYTAPATSGTYRVAAHLPDAQTAEVVVHVTTGAAITITPNPALALPDGDVRFAATVSGIADERVVWSVQEGVGAAYLSADGQLSTGDAGVLHVVATSVADPSIRAVATVTVAGDVVDFGGPLLPAPAVRAIWWGTPEQFGDTVDAVAGFLSDLGGSPWLAVLDQYLRGARANVTYAGHLFLSGAPTTAQPADDEVVGAVCRALDANGIAPDPSGVYLLFTPLPPQPGGWWGLHWSGECHGVPVAVAWISRGSQLSTCGSRSPEADAAVFIAAHELVEAMTDPRFHQGWLNWDHYEIADRCAPACVRVGSSGYSLPTLWSNAAQRCVAG
jgi:hypothetical protein